MKNSFRDLTGFERGLWLTSVAVVVLSGVLSRGNLLTTAASLVGVTALIFVSKGYVLGQVLTVAFSVFYGVISWHFHYYGEMITYLGMTAPMAAAATVSWLRHPYRDSREVEVHQLTRKQTAGLWGSAVLVTVAFYFLLGALGNASLPLSTLSIFTSFLASALTFLRSPWYALAYSANDVVLILLWILAAIKEPSYLPMIACFSMFLANDLYGFYNWRRIQRRQN